MCSLAEYERLFIKYKTTSSHASQRFHRLLVSGMVSNGVEIETVTHRSIKKPDAAEQKKMTEIENEIKYNYLPQVRFEKLNRIYTIISAYFKLVEIKKTNPDMFICVDILKGELSIAANLFKIFHKCTMTAIVTDVPSYRATETRKGLMSIPYRLKNALIAGYDNYVFLTEQMNDLLNYSHKPYVIIEGVADNSFNAPMISLDEKYTEKVVMMAGLLEPEYGVDDLVRAFHNIKMDDIRLHLYGRGSSVNIIKDYASKDSRICFFGEVLNQQILDEERKVTLLVNPRKLEGEWVKYSFPSKNIEYMASGTPLLAYYLPCIPQEYADKFFVIDPENLEESLKNILSLKREDLNFFGIKAQKWICEQKKPHIQASKIIKMLEKQ